MHWQLFFVLSLGFLFSGSATSAEKCAEEKEEADYWNRLMRERVTEMRRTNHRQAKADFLDCLGEDDSATSKKPQVKVYRGRQSDARNMIRQNVRRSAPRKGYTQDIFVSSYHNFEGAKRKAWSQFFKEPQECMNNDGNMNMFVKCTNERKYYLEQFNQRWDEKTQSLASPLSKSWER